MNYEYLTNPDNIDISHPLLREQVKHYCLKNTKKLNVEFMQNHINKEFTKEYFFSKIGKNYDEIREYFQLPDILKREKLTINSILNEIMLYIGSGYYSFFEQGITDIKVLRYTTSLVIANFLNAELSIIQGAQVVLHTYIYNKRNNIAQEEDNMCEVCYETMLECLTEETFNEII